MYSSSNIKIGILLKYLQKGSRMKKLLLTLLCLGLYSGVFGYEEKKKAAVAKKLKAEKAEYSSGKGKGWTKPGKEDKFRLDDKIRRDARRWREFEKARRQAAFNRWRRMQYPWWRGVNPRYRTMCYLYCLRRAC